MSNEDPSKIDEVDDDKMDELLLSKLVEEEERSEDIWSDDEEEGFVKSDTRTEGSIANDGAKKLDLSKMRNLNE